MIILGAGFTGLSAGYELAKAGVPVTILEADDAVGGLAAAMHAGDRRFDRFYHHWFTSDADALALVDELGWSDHLVFNATDTRVLYNRSIHRMSSPLDLLRFPPLSLVDRIRLGSMVIRTRAIREWKTLEQTTAAEWLKTHSSDRVYEVVWKPLLEAKFGAAAETVSAVWIWNKIKLRGGSRGRDGRERLAAFRGGFAAFAHMMADRIRSLGGTIHLNASVTRLDRMQNVWKVRSTAGDFTSQHIVATFAPPVIADLISHIADADYVTHLKRIDYLANVCLVLELSRPLSDVYWLNISDPGFPFVSVIEHTNFERADSYGGRHLVYLSRYLPHTDPYFALDADALFEAVLPHLTRIFPRFDRSWVLDRHAWRARWAQPVVVTDYSRNIPAEDSPLAGLHLCSMAQIYPEDRGTNHAIRAGRRLGARLAASCASQA